MSTNVSANDKIRIPAGESGRRLDRFLRRRFPLASLPDIYSQIRTGRVRLNGKKCRPAHRVHEGDLLTLPGSLVSEGGRRSPPLASRVDIRLEYQDSDLIVVDKPPGLVVHPGSRHTSNTLVGQAGLLLRRAGKEADVHLVHRLDRNTSGLLVLARSPRIARALSEMFRAGGISKEYTALVAGQTPQRGSIRVPLAKKSQSAGRRVQPGPGGLSASTSYVRLASKKGFSLLGVTLQTGRTHQIRAHLRYIGHPILGDPRYGQGDTNRKFRLRYGLDRQFLHASRLGFAHPSTGKSIRIRSSLPADLKSVLQRVGIPGPT